MPEGEKIGEGYVEVRVDVDDNGLDTATEKVTRKIDDDLSKAAPGIGEKAGKQIGDGLESELGAGGERSARSFMDNFAAHESEFTTFAESFGKDWFAKFNGNSEGALDELNRMFNEKFDAGGFSASNLFWEEFDKKAKSAVEDLTGGGSSGGNKRGLFSSLFSGDSLGQLAEVPGTIAENIWPIIITGAIAAAPAIGATIAGGITAAVGAGGIATGIALQFNNPQVHSAATTLANDLEQELKTASTGFIEPTTKAFDILGSALTAEGSRFRSIFDSLAPSVEGIAVGIGQFVDRLMPGIEALSKASFPVLDQLSGQLPGLGRAVSDFFSDIANSGKGAGEAIVATFKVVEYTLESTGVTIEALSKTFDWIINNPLMNILGGALFTKFFDGVRDGSNTAGKGINEFGNNSDQAAQQLTQLDNALQQATTDFDKLIGRNVGAEQAQDRFREGLEQLSQAVQNNGISLDQNTLAGAKNRNVLASQITNLKDARDAYIAQQTPILGVTKATQNANVIYGQNILALEGQAAKLGLNKQQVDALIRSLLGLPPSKTTNVSTPGAQTSKDAVNALSSALNSLPYSRTVYVNILTSEGPAPPGTSSGSGKKRTGSQSGGIGTLLDPGGGNYLGGIHHAATGGVFDAGVYSKGPILFAEPETNPGTGGKEAFIPYMTPDPTRATNVLREAASWYGLAVVPLNASKGSSSTSAPTPPPPSSGTGKTVTLNYYGERPDASTRYSIRRDLDLAVL